VKVVAHRLDLLIAHLDALGVLRTANDLRLVVTALNTIQAMDGDALSRIEEAIEHLTRIRGSLGLGGYPDLARDVDSLLEALTLCRSA
jgi:hypothetical protein